MMLTLTLVTSLIVAQLTHALALTKYFGSVRASSFVTLIFVGITSLFPSSLVPGLQAACLGASFIGMTDPKRLTRLQISCASLIFAFFFTFLLSYLKGAGGALGFSAFISCLIVHFFWHLILKKALKYRRPNE